jgi:membrane-bound ClpP family serine protease
MDPVIWSGLLLVVGLLLAVGEIFIPSVGLLGFLSVASMLAAIGLAFYTHGVGVGLLFLTVTAVAGPVTLMAALRVWPKTPMGRRLLLDVPREDEVLPDSPARRTLRGLVGKMGTAHTLMLPSGVISIGGLSVDAVSEGPPIEPGTRIRVLDVHGNRVLVRPVTPDEQETTAESDVLSQPIESLGLDPFDDPLA